MKFTNNAAELRHYPHACGGWAAGNRRAWEETWQREEVANINEGIAEILAILAASGMSASGQDAKPASPTAEGGDAQTSHESPTERAGRSNASRDTHGAS